MNMKQIIATFITSFAVSCTACAGPSSQNLSAASEHAALASIHGSAALVKGAASVVAVPLLVVGSAGLAVGVAGSAMAEFASEPLPLGSELRDDTVDKHIHTPTPDPATALGEM